MILRYKPNQTSRSQECIITLHGETTFQTPTLTTSPPWNHNMFVPYYKRAGFRSREELIAIDAWKRGKVYEAQGATHSENAARRTSVSEPFVSLTLFLRYLF
jgi:hypothetical protein